MLKQFDSEQRRCERSFTLISMRDMRAKWQAEKVEHRTTAPPQFKEDAEWRSGPRKCAWGVVSGLSTLQLSWHGRARQMVLQNAEEEAVAQSLSRPCRKPP